MQYTESLFIEDLHLPVELLSFTEERPVLRDVTLKEAVASTDAMKQGPLPPCLDDDTRTGAVKRKDW